MPPAYITLCKTNDTNRALQLLLIQVFSDSSSRDSVDCVKSLDYQLSLLHFITEAMTSFMCLGVGVVFPFMLQ